VRKIYLSFRALFIIVNMLRGLLGVFRPRKQRTSRNPSSCARQKRQLQGACIPGPKRPGFIEAAFRPSMPPRHAGIPGPKRPGFIEAPIMKSRVARASSVFPGRNARASLKLALSHQDAPFSDGIPGPKRPGFIEAPKSCRRRVALSKRSRRQSRIVGRQRCSVG